MWQGSLRKSVLENSGVDVGVVFGFDPCQAGQRDLCITGVWLARTSVDGRVFMGPAESYFGRASLPVDLVHRCDLSRSVSSCSLHGALEVVQPLGRRAVGCVFVPFLWWRIWGAFLPFRIFRIGCCFEYFDL